MMNPSFHYKWEQTDKIVPSAVHNEKSYLFVFWIVVLLVGFLTLFSIGYKQQSTSTNKIHPDRNIQSLYSVQMEPFLARVMTANGLVLAKIKIQFFVQDINVQKEINEDKNQYKEQLIFFLSSVKDLDFSNQSKHQALEEKIKNHINSFLSSGKVQHISIQNQFIDKEVSHG